MTEKTCQNVNISFRDSRRGPPGNRHGSSPRIGLIGLETKSNRTKRLFQIRNQNRDGAEEGHALMLYLSELLNDKAIRLIGTVELDVKRSIGRATLDD